MTISETTSSYSARFEVPPTVSSEAAAILTVLYEASRLAPAPVKPSSADDFTGVNRQLEAAFAPANEQLAVRLGTTIRRDQLGGVPIVRIIPSGDHKDARVLVYVHGGAYVYFSAGTMIGLPSLIAKATGIEAISID